MKLQTLIKLAGLTEELDTTMKMNMPFFIRMLEWAREECKSDAELHEVVERVAKVRHSATMDDYDFVLGKVKKEY